MKEKFEFRAVFNEKSIRQTALQIKAVYPAFKEKAFVRDVLDGFEALSFGDRNAKITDVLYSYLPKVFPTAVAILTASLGETLQVEELKGYEGFYVMPLSTYVSRYGVDHYEISIEALIEMTQRFTSEWAIRTFLEHEESKTLAHLEVCTKSDNCHIRRLVSEGTRPRLPLASRLYNFIKDPTPVLRLLELLKGEPTRLVQRSIANNLNDIGKDNPDAVVAFLTRWKKEQVKDVEWIIRHATRSLVKEGHLGTLRLLGFDPDIAIDHITLNVTTPIVILGDTLGFECEIYLANQREEKVVVDYLLYFKKANSVLKPKVFKLSSQSIMPNATLRLSKKQPLKPVSTRKYYAGEQAIQLQINGKLMGTPLSFELKIPLPT